MSEDDQQHKEPVTPAEEEAPAPPRDRLGLAVLALVVAVVALLVGGYAWYHSAVQARLTLGEQAIQVKALSDTVAGLKSSQSQLDDQYAKLRERLDGSQSALNDRLEAATAQLRKQSAEQQQHLDSTAKALRGEMTELSRSVTGVTDALDHSAMTLAVREAEQLLVLASRQVKLADNAALAETALKLADDRLKALDEPRFVAVRKQIADDLAKLAAVPKVDVDGIALQLDSLANNAAGLPLAGNAPPARETGSAAPAADGGLAATGKELLSDLSALVKVKKVDETGAPTLTANQQALVYENLRLQLSAAKVALLRRDAEPYQQSLAAAEDWVRQRFVTDDSAVSQLLANLKKLAAIDIAPPLPDVSAAFDVLKQAAVESGS